MPEFMDLLETVRAEEASADRLFGDAGSPIRARRRTDPRYVAALAEAAGLVADVFQGRRPVWRLQEAMTTSDFPYLFGDILDRQMLGAYREYPSPWTQFARRGTVPDFRTVKRFTVDGADAVLSEVGQLDEYKEAKLVEGRYTYAVKKYGRKVAFSWEALVNNDLDMLRDLPNRLGRGARRTEAKFVTDLYVGTTGPDGTFFSNTNKNVVNTTNGASSTNPPLSITGLQDAMIVLSKQVDSGGEPIFVETVTLVVPPALLVTAQNILNAVEIGIDPNSSAGTAKQTLRAQNWMRNNVKLAVDPYIPIIASSSNGSTSWFLFANPNTDGRPAIEIGFLRGHEEPEIFEKMPNQRKVGGGTDPMDGSFELDAREWKVRHVVGGSLLDPKAAVASNGSGS